jgi:hypothetical protein
MSAAAHFFGNEIGTHAVLNLKSCLSQQTTPQSRCCRTGFESRFATGLCLDRIAEMRCKMRSRLAALVLVVLLLTPTLAFAQNINIEWNRWDAQLAVQQNNQMQVAETQEIHVLNGTVRQGTRYWNDPVQIQAVYEILGNSQQPRALSQGNSGQPGTYNVSQDGNKTTLTYFLDTPQNAGDTFIAQINYAMQLPTGGLVDWSIIPPDHAFNVRSSTVRIQFPNGQAPDSSLVRVISGNANVSVTGNEVVLQSQGNIPPQQAFAVQVPFGAGVGAAGNTGNTGNVPPVSNPGDTGINPVNPVVPADNPGGTSFALPGCGTLLLIACVVGFLLLWGGGSLLRGLLGGGGRVLGGGGSSGAGGLGGLFGGGTNQGPLGGGQQGPFGSSSDEVNRGFRPSADQNRDLGNVGNDKDRGGGGASFG